MNDRIERFLKLLPERRLVRWIAAPALFRFAWNHGSTARPLIYQRFVIQAIFFAFPLGILLTLWDVFNGPYSKVDFVVMIMSSTAWGIGCASGLNGFKRKLKLPDKWDSI